MYHNEPGDHKLCKADTGAIRFKVRYPMEIGIAAFTLTSKKNPKKDLYQVFFAQTCKFVDNTQTYQRVTRRFNLAEPIGSDFREFWLTWHSCVIRLGVVGQPEPILTYADDNISSNNIGFIKFYSKGRWAVEWIFEASPVILKPPKEKSFQGGHLHWVSLTDGNQSLPDNALIGGFQLEPLYIFRAGYNGSLCPGKYIASVKCGYVPWGGRENIIRQRGQILCGFNVKWVKTKGNCIPENAFVAGYSELRRQHLYIGRAMFDNQLLVGKVHTLYSTCYLPYCGKEVEVCEYEILVSTDTNPRGTWI